MQVGLNHSEKLTRVHRHVHARIYYYMYAYLILRVLRCDFGRCVSNFQRWISVGFHPVWDIFLQKKEKMLGCKNNYYYFCIAFERKGALSSAGSERLRYKQRVGGSNPSAPTRNSEIPFTKLAVWQKGA